MTTQTLEYKAIRFDEKIGYGQQMDIASGYSTFETSVVHLTLGSVCQTLMEMMNCLLSSEQQSTESTINDKKMLIDGHQPEETRVVLLNGNKIEEFDYENNSLTQLKGNVYLARVTRVEPSLQAAFIEYGGNRQGFLAFSEIYPDYYRIPVEDREALTAQSDTEVEQDPASEQTEDSLEDTATDNSPEEIGGDDEHDSRSQSSESVMRRYKIQEVITRKQILLVQVVKEERGNKGAALTTYLSLPADIVY